MLVEVPAGTVTADCGVMTHAPVGGAGAGGTGVIDGLQPASDTVATGVCPSATVTLQSGAVKPDASILKPPFTSMRALAALVVDLAITTDPPGAAPLPSTRS